MFDELLKILLIAVLLILGVCGLCIVIGEVCSCPQEQEDEEDL